jgi:hypothetical protein
MRAAAMTVVLPRRTCDKRERMKRHHAAALALVGWYLMVPPTQSANHVDPFVPLSKWIVLKAFDTATACNDGSNSRPYVTLESTKSRRIGRIGSGQVFTVHRQRRSAPEGKIDDETPQRRGRGEVTMATISVIVVALWIAAAQTERQRDAEAEAQRLVRFSGLKVTPASRFNRVAIFRHRR